MLEMHLQSIDNGDRMVFFWMNCHGWIRQSQGLLRRLKDFGTTGDATETT